MSVGLLVGTVLSGLASGAARRKIAEHQREQEQQWQRFKLATDWLQQGVKAAAQRGAKQDAAALQQSLTKMLEKGASSVNEFDKILKSDVGTRTIARLSQVGEGIARSPLQMPTLGAQWGGGDKRDFGLGVDYLVNNEGRINPDAAPTAMAAQEQPMGWGLPQAPAMEAAEEFAYRQQRGTSRALDESAKRSRLFNQAQDEKQWMAAFGGQPEGEKFREQYPKAYAHFRHTLTVPTKEYWDTLEVMDAQKELTKQQISDTLRQRNVRQFYEYDEESGMWKNKAPDWADLPQDQKVQFDSKAQYYKALHETDAQLKAINKEQAMIQYYLGRGLAGTHQQERWLQNMNYRKAKGILDQAARFAASQIGEHIDIDLLLNGGYNATQMEAYAEAMRRFVPMITQGAITYDQLIDIIRPSDTPTPIEAPTDAAEGMPLSSSHSEEAMSINEHQRRMEEEADILLRKIIGER